MPATKTAIARLSALLLVFAAAPALAGAALNFSTADNFWYGPNALPPIASTIVIDAVRAE